MNQEVLNMIKSGKIPYRYEYDTESALYFGLAILVVIFAFAIAQSVTNKIIG